MDKAHKQTDRIISDVENHLIKIYARAAKENKDKAKKYLKEFARLDKQQISRVKSGTLTAAEYKSWRKQAILLSKKFKELEKQIANELLNVNKTAIAYVNGELPEVYSLNYNFLSNSVNGVGGYSFTLTDANTVRNLAIKDDTLLPYKSVNGVKDVRWNTKIINSEVLQGLLQGESMDKIAERFIKVTQMNYSSAIRNARTAVTGAECKGRQDSYEKAEKDGIILEKEWMATNDNKTRHWHAELNGVRAKTDESFENSMGKIRYPGDPEASPANVYN